MTLDDDGEKKMSEWQRINTPALRWMSDRLEVTKHHGDMVPVEAAYQDYRQWCKNHGHRELNSIHWGKTIGPRLVRKYADGKRQLIGARLKPMDSFWG